MSVNAISGLGDSYLPSLSSSPLQGLSVSAGSLSISVTSISISSQNSDSSQLSPFAKIVSTLHRVQHSDPAEYAKLTALIAKNLQSAAQSAESSGNTASADKLNQLAADFTSASVSGKLPNLKDLRQALNSDQTSSAAATTTADTANATSGTLTANDSANTSNPTSSASNSGSSSSFTKLLDGLKNFLSQLQQIMSSAQGSSQNPNSISISSLSIVLDTISMSGNTLTDTSIKINAMSEQANFG